MGEENYLKIREFRADRSMEKSGDASQDGLAKRRKKKRVTGIGGEIAAQLRGGERRAPATAGARPSPAHDRAPDVTKSARAPSYSVLFS